MEEPSSRSRLPPGTGLRIGELSRRVGVSPEVLRAWERRYGVPHPHRTLTGRRVYTDRDIAYYAINDRSAGRRAIELDLMTTAQHEAMPEEEDVTAADRLIVESPTTTGLIAIRALAPDPGLMPMAKRAVEGARCQHTDLANRAD